MLKTDLYLDGRPAQQEEHHVWYWKPSLLPRSSEVMDLGENPTATTLLNHSISNYILNICSYAHR